MDVIEKAIRSAFDKGTPEDRTFREQVYRQAFAALDRALQANPNLTVENAIARRKQLQAQIVEIESEFIPAVHGAAPRSPEPEKEAPTVTPPRQAVPDPGPTVPRRYAASLAALRPGAGSAPRVEPDFSLDAPAVPALDDVVPASPAPERKLSRREAACAERAAGGYDPRLRQRRGSFRGAVVICLLLAAIGGAGWWAVGKGLLQLPAGQNTGEVRPAEQGEAEDFAPEDAGTPPPLGPAESGPERTWITIFEPSDPTRVSAPADATAEVMQDESGSFLRMRSGASGSAAGFDVGQGVLERLAGKKAVFDIIARAEGGGQTEMAVDCNFGELGDCGRKRYAVGYERAEYLFKVQFPDTSPGAGGTIAVNSDFAGEGRAIDIYEIRVATE